MRLALTGTPCVGKTTVAAELADRGHEVHDVNALVESGMSLGRDEDRDSLLADVDALRDALSDADGVLESHLSHLLNADTCVVLRCHPDELGRRGANRENREAEALDAVLIDAAAHCDDLHEIDTTDRSPDEVADLVEQVMRGEAEFPPGRIDWTDWLAENP